MIRLTSIFIPCIIALLTCNWAGASPRPCWIFFKDRGGIDVKREIAAKTASPSEPKNNSRRARIMRKDALFDERDLPVNPAYCARIRDIAGNIRTMTRYFNGVSANLDEQALEEVRNLPFVSGVRPVVSFRRPEEPQPSGTMKRGQAEDQTRLSYGVSLNQLKMIGIIDLQNLGYMGNGITIAILDSGFDTMEHSAFDSIRVAGVRDFVDGDDDITGDNHGSQVLSVLAAFDNGKMIGSAPYAAYVLARTEIRSEELRIEEDYWVAGLEWADSLGADIVNSSLGYVDFDDARPYTPEDLDGRTAVTTVAADYAAKRGIVVVASAGNEGDKPWHYVTTPADGFKVIAVGSVDANGEISAFSSRGPTYDGRIKPDVVALGEDVAVINTETTTSYKTVQGTSYAAPAVSGTAALLLEINVAWGPEDVRSALLTTASKGVAEADTVYGYGIVNAFAASGLEKPEPPVTAFKAYDPYPQPLTFNNGTGRLFFPMDIPREGELSIRIFNFSGETVKTIETVFKTPGSKHDRTEAPNWDGTNFTGDDVAPGIYFYNIDVGYARHTGKIAVIR